MGKTDEIVSDALDLSDEERAEVAHRLFDSLEAVDPHAHLSDEALTQEIVRRARSAVDGDDLESTWDDVKRRITDKLNKSSSSLPRRGRDPRSRSVVP